MLAWHVTKGDKDGVDLSGLNAVLAVHSPKQMTDGGWKLALYLDDRATAGAVGGAGCGLLRRRGRSSRGARAPRSARSQASRPPRSRSTGRSGSLRAEVAGVLTMSAEEIKGMDGASAPVITNPLFGAIAQPVTQAKAGDVSYHGALGRRVLGHEQLRHRLQVRGLTRTRRTRRRSACRSGSSCRGGSGSCALAALAWVVTVDQANGMGIGPGTMGLTLLAFLALWVVMMAAMMLPSVAPMVIVWVRSVSVRATAWERVSGVAQFLAGYLVVWAAFGLLGLRRVRRRRASGRPVARPPRSGSAPAIFAVAGIYQLTPLKEVCLRHCRSPVGIAVPLRELPRSGSGSPRRGSITAPTASPVAGG